MNIEIETKAERFSLPIRDGETILMAGLAAGFSLPYECATGTCGTCHARVMNGQCDIGWAEAPGYAKLKPGNGDILMCQARALSDCSLRVRSRQPQPDNPIATVLDRTGRIDVIRRLTPDVVDFDLALSSPISFDAGQFVTIRSPALIGRRAYSMVNYGRDLVRLRFVVKRKPGGKFSDWLFDNDVLGQTLDISGPLGHATFRPAEARNIVCIAGGSGIAGMMSILDHAMQINYFEKHRGAFFFGVRTLRDAFYLQEFADHLSVAKRGLDVTIAVSHEEPTAPVHRHFAGINVAHGMVHEVAAARMVGRWDHSTGFVAGPQPMVDAALRVLITQAGLPSEAIRFDKFS